MADIVLKPDAAIKEEVKGRSLWQDAWHRLLRNHAAVVSGIIIIFIVLLSFFGPYFLGHPFDEVNWDRIDSQPDFAAGYYFGGDGNGRDLFVRTLYGGRVSITIGVVATLVSLVIGVTWGAIAGFVGGRADGIMMRFVDILYSVPFIFFVIMLTVAFGSSKLLISLGGNMVLMYAAIGAVSWLDMARIVRGQTLSLKRKEFVEAAHASGVSTFNIIRRHIIPNTLGPVIVYVTLTVPNVMLIESFISFLGMGVQEPNSSWGVLVSEGARLMDISPWGLLGPCAFLSVTLLCLNYLGDGMRDAFDPKDR